MPGPSYAPRPVPRLCNLEDRFHGIQDDNQFIRSVGEMGVFLQKVMRPASKIFVCWRYWNDLRYAPESIAVFSIRAAMSMTTFHFFILGEDALPRGAVRDCLRMVCRKEVRAQVGGPLQRLCRRLIDHSPQKFRSLVAQIGNPHKGTVLDAATQVVFNQKHCPAHYDNLVTKFSDCTPQFFAHIAASLFVVEWFPWDEPEFATEHGV